MTRLTFFEDTVLKTRIKSKLYRCLIAEFICTAFLMYIGCNINAQMLLSKKELNNYTALSIGWGLVIMFSVQLGYNISGSHMNCAVSFMMYTFGHLSFMHFIYYCIVQTSGAFFGAALSYMHYYDLITVFDSGIRTVTGPKATAGVFATYPHEYLSFTGAIFDQTMCTFVLCFSLGIIMDPKNKIPRTAQPPMVGLLVFLMCLGFGLNAGNAMNPARDLGPRLFTLIAGYGWETFSYWNYRWFLIPIICPLIGGAAGGWFYHLIFAANLDEYLPSEHHHKLYELQDKDKVLDSPISSIGLSQILIGKMPVEAMA